MNEQVVRSYEYLEIENNSKCFNQGKLTSYFLRGYYPDETELYIKDSFINEKISKFGSSLKISFMSNLMEDKGIVEFIDSMIFLESKDVISICSTGFSKKVFLLWPNFGFFELFI